MNLKAAICELGRKFFKALGFKVLQHVRPISKSANRRI